MPPPTTTLGPGGGGKVDITLSRMRCVLLFSDGESQLDDTGTKKLLI